MTGTYTHVRREPWPLLREIDRLMAVTGVTPSRVGRDSVGDPRLVSDLRAGRFITEWREARVREWMARKAVRA